MKPNNRLLAGNWVLIIKLKTETNDFIMIIVSNKLYRDHCNSGENKLISIDSTLHVANSKQSVTYTFSQVILHKILSFIIFLITFWSSTLKRDYLDYHFLCQRHCRMYRLWNTNSRLINGIVLLMATQNQVKIVIAMKTIGENEVSFCAGYKLHVLFATLAQN